jgi:hypothetical protein
VAPASPETAVSIRSGHRPGPRGTGTAVGGAWRDERDPSTGAAADQPSPARPRSLPLPAGEAELGSTRTQDRPRPPIAAWHREAPARTAPNRVFVAGVAFPPWSPPTTLLSAGG